VARNPFASEARDLQHAREVGLHSGLVEGMACPRDERPRWDGSPVVFESTAEPVSLDAIEQDAEIGADIDAPHLAALGRSQDGDARGPAGERVRDAQLPDAAAVHEVHLHVVKPQAA